MSRPKFLHVGGTLYWVITTRNPDTMVLKDADLTPSVAVRKNGASTADSVTITKRSATTGIYDCSYNPASEAEGDEFTIEETATVTGTTTGAATYSNSWEFTVLAVERGTNGALTTLGTNAPADWFNAAAISADAGAELAALVETYIVNEGDATAVLQAVADAIAADWVAGDASPLAIASAVWSAGTRTITGGSLTTAPPTASAIADAVWDELRTGHTTPMGACSHRTPAREKRARLPMHAPSSEPPCSRAGAGCRARRRQKGSRA
jgi:hypothetical protein